MFNNYPDIMSVKDVMTALDICKHSAYQLIESKQIASFRVGRAHKIPKTALIQYVNAMAQGEK